LRHENSPPAAPLFQAPRPDACDFPDSR